MIKLASETIDRDDINALIEWLSQDPIPQLTKGPLTGELEQKWANKIGTKYSVFVNSGSSAIFLLLAALKESGKLKNNKIVVPALSWSTDVSSPMLLNMHPIMCDCNLHDLSCDLDRLEKIFFEERPSCFLMVSPLGLVPDMDAIIALCKEYDVILLEDVCESMGSKYEERYLGSFGFASLFSTYFGHHISTIEGGFINTNDEELYHHLLMMRSHGWNRDLPQNIQNEMNQSHGVSKFKALYTFYVPGMNLRSTDLQAFLGLRAIDKLDRYSEKRNKNFKLYYLLLKDNLLKLQLHERDFTSNFAYPIVSYNRDKIIEKLSNNNIDSRPLIAGNIANNPFWNKSKFSKKGELYPHAELIDKYGFYIPNHHDLSKQEIEIIVNIINET